MSANFPVTSKTVFVSYPSEEKRWAEDVCSEIESRGIACWIAPRDIDPGREFPDAIVAAIDSVRIMIVIFSKHAELSKYVVREVRQGLDRELIIIPCRVEDSKPNGALGLLLGNNQWHDVFAPNADEKIQRLADAVQAIVNMGRSNQVPIREQSANGRGLFKPARSIKRWVNIIAVFLALVGAAILITRTMNFSNFISDGPAKNPPNMASAPPISPVEINGVEYRIEDYGWEGARLMFHILASNKGAETVAAIACYDSKLYDDHKEGTPASGVVVGSDFADGTLRVRLPAKQAIRIKLYFDRVNPQIKVVELLEVRLFGGPVLPFEHIPVENKKLLPVSSN